jgi:hypothetical protein
MTDKVLGPADHFLRGAAGEGEQEDALSRDTALQQAGNARGERFGFTRACAGDNQKRSVAMRSGGALVQV